MTVRFHETCDVIPHSAILPCYLSDDFVNTKHVLEMGKCAFYVDFFSMFRQIFGSCVNVQRFFLVLSKVKSYEPF